MNSSVNEDTNITEEISSSCRDVIVIDETSSEEITSTAPTESCEFRSKDERLIDNNTGSSDLGISTLPESSEPLFTVSFRDEQTARLYQEDVKESLRKLFTSKSDIGIIQRSELVLEVRDNDAAEKESEDLVIEIDSSQDSENNLLFTIDKQPAPKDDLNVPTYGKKYNKVYEKSSGETAEDPKEDQFIHKIACFNCLENHSLRECSKPLDHAVINKNRKEFSMNNNRSTRYHLDNEQRFGHLVPGSLSKNLRKALGLKDNQLPRHIYRMRILGYPPGWLEEARLQHSGLTLFNSNGVPEKDPTEEPGEIFTDPSDKDQYDIKKIYDFPGFNVPPPPGIRDEHKQHWAPQMQPIHSKEMMLSMLQGKQAEDGYKRKKLKICTTSTVTESQTTPSEMDVEEVTESVVETVPVNGYFLPPLPKDTPVKPPEPPTSSQLSCEDSDGQSQEPYSPNSENGESTAPSSRTNSPSLSDLEHMKKRLLVELEDSSSQSNPGTPVRNDSTARHDPKSERTPTTNRKQDTRSSLNSSQGSVKSVDLGTPVLQSTSPYSKLPSSEKFSKNICDVITYENLPDSTGKYVQLTGILQKVRHTLSKIHQDS